ncbi:DUF4167 domain-containing protein [Bosea sp. UC22_33]|uniref:DUF4167 domain-containing protein n=1 Tax=Bosea sp. UC22_33 TaxID=3350165 RepID=UPI0036725BD7
MRGRNNSGGGNNNGNRKSPNPLQRSYESNGPDVKVRGTAQHVAEKYLQLARDAQSSGDTVAAESYFQFAEHYYRILLAAQEQMAQQFGHSFPPNRAFVEDADDGEEEGDEDGQSFQPGTGPQPEMRSNGYANANVNGYNGHGGGQRPEGEGGEGQQQGGQRFDRQGRRERFNNDRNSNNSERRFDRQDRGERRFDRNAEGGQGAPGGYAPRPDAPRSDIPVSEGGAVEAAPEQAQGEQRRFEPRPERSERPQRERRPRREREVEADANDDVAAALPSFLTNPVRVPASEPVEAPAAEPAAASAEPAGDEAAPKRTRRRRSPREVMDALGSETDGSAE